MFDASDPNFEMIGSWLRQIHHITVRLSLIPVVMCYCLLAYWTDIVMQHAMKLLYLQQPSFVFTNLYDFT